MRKWNFKATLSFLSCHVMAWNDKHRKTYKRKLSSHGDNRHKVPFKAANSTDFPQYPQMWHQNNQGGYQNQGGASWRGQNPNQHYQASTQRYPNPNFDGQFGSGQFTVSVGFKGYAEPHRYDNSAAINPNSYQGYYDRGGSNQQYPDRGTGHLPHQNSYNNNAYRNQNRGRGNSQNRGASGHNSSRPPTHSYGSGPGNQSRKFSSDSKSRENNWNSDKAAGKNDSHLVSPQTSTVSETQSNFSSGVKDRDNGWNEGREAGKDDRRPSSPQESTAYETERTFHADAGDRENDGNKDREADKDDRRPSSPQESTANETEKTFHADAGDRENDGNKAIFANSTAGKDDWGPVPPHASTSYETERSKDKLQSKDGNTSQVNKKNKQQNSHRSSDLWMGVPLDKLKRAPECFKEKKQAIEAFIRADNEIFDVKLESMSVGRAATNFLGEDYAPMPYIAYNKDAQKGPYSRWEFIKDVLSWDIGNSKALENAIQSYSPYSCKFDVLHQFFETIGSAESFRFFNKTLPKMQELALRLPELCPKSLPILKQRTNKKITLSQEQVACLLAHAFFCTFPKRPYQPKGDQTGNNRPKGSKVPDINFNTLYSEPMSNRKIEKLKCLIHYFQRVTEKMPKGNVTYARQFEPLTKDFWFKNENKLTDLYVSTKGTIEDVGVGMLQADFANKFVGGGVLTNGLVQEEISFVLCPEMILSRLFTEMLTENEVLIMTGCERFSSHKGYSNTFVFTGDYEDHTERDVLGRRCIEVVAMDALVFRDYGSQFEQYNVSRELSKAYCAFKRNEVYTGNLPAVCTGNWGCGAFGGDKQLKALIQMMAASAAGRDVCYLTFDDAELCHTFGEIHNILKEKEYAIKDILEFILEYGWKLYKFPNTEEYLFQYLAAKLQRKLEHREINEQRKKQNTDSNEKINKHSASMNEIINKQSSGMNEARDRQSSGMNEARDRQSSGMNEARDRQSSGMNEASDRQSSGMNEKRDRHSSDTTEKKNRQSPDAKEKGNKQSPDAKEKGNKQSPHKEASASSSHSSKKKKNKKKKK